MSPTPPPCAVGAVPYSDSGLDGATLTDIGQMVESQSITALHDMAEVRAKSQMPENVISRVE